MSTFYLTLPSNSSMNTFPENRTTSYTTKLPDEIQLNGVWEVALKEIQYPVSWLNILETEGDFNLIISEMTRTHKAIVRELLPPGTGDIIHINYHIPAGHYSNGEDIAIQFNKAVHNEVRTYARLSFDNVTGLFTIELREGMKATISKQLHEITGLRQRLNYSQKSKFIGDMHRGIYSLYVYSDICKEVVVGDSKVPMLRVVPIKGRHGDYINQIYDNPTYTQVQRNNIDTIQIDIRDDSGHKIHFQYGKAVVVLQFKKKK